MIRLMLGVRDIFLEMLLAISLMIISALRFLNLFWRVLLMVFLVQRHEMIRLLSLNMFTAIYPKANDIEE
jgi:hypothetical protein